MTTAALPLVRSLIIYGICMPLAMVLGYMMASPYDLTTLSVPFFVVGSVLFCLLLPLLLRWHHPWLIATWNMTVVLFFLPGRPLVWLVLAWISFGIAFVQYIMNRKHRFLEAPTLARPLIFLVV